MTLEPITEFMQHYGPAAVFLVVFLEYLNLPGFPAGIIMPAAGALASKGSISFGLTLSLSVAAGILGSWLLYLVGRLGGTVFLRWFKGKFPKTIPALDKTILTVSRYGYWGILGGKLLPAVRTLISIPAGVLQIKFLPYTLCSSIGIVIWNLTFIGAGYFFGSSLIA